VRIWDARKRDVVRAASLGFPIAGLAFSNERYPLTPSGPGAIAAGAAPGGAKQGQTVPTTQDGFHLALGSAGGYK
jgi:hypothetical protein